MHVYANDKTSFQLQWSHIVHDIRDSQYKSSNFRKWLYFLKCNIFDNILENKLEHLILTINEKIIDKINHKLHFV